MTDADLTLGYLNADFILGGAKKIDRAATDGAFKRLSGTLGVEAGRAAFGVHDVVNENMAGAARVAIAERGRIPAEYALLATGGAGPLSDGEYPASLIYQTVAHNELPGSDHDDYGDPAEIAVALTNERWAGADRPELDRNL